MKLKTLAAIAGTALACLAPSPHGGLSGLFPRVSTAAAQIIDAPNKCYAERVIGDVKAKAQYGSASLELFRGGDPFVPMSMELSVDSFRRARLLDHLVIDMPKYVIRGPAGSASKSENRPRIYQRLSEIGERKGRVRIMCTAPNGRSFKLVSQPLDFGGFYASPQGVAGKKIFFFNPSSPRSYTWSLRGKKAEALFAFLERADEVAITVAEARRGETILKTRLGLRRLREAADWALSQGRAFSARTRKHCR